MTTGKLALVYLMKFHLARQNSTRGINPLDITSDRVTVARKGPLSTEGCSMTACTLLAVSYERKMQKGFKVLGFW